MRGRGVGEGRLRRLRGWWGEGKEEDVGKGDRGEDLEGSGLVEWQMTRNRSSLTVTLARRPCPPRLSVPASDPSLLSLQPLSYPPSSSLLFPRSPLFSLRALRALPRSSHSILPASLGASPMPLPRQTQPQDAPRWKGKERDLVRRDEGDGASDGIVIDLTLITDSPYQS